MVFSLLTKVVVKFSYEISVIKLKNYFLTVNVMIVDSDISQQIKLLLFAADTAVPIVTPKHW